MAIQRKKILIWMSLLVITTACVLPSVGAPQTVPTIDPGAVNTYIAQTANAASTQTVAAMPTSTPTATATSTPRNTDTPTPTATNTVVFILKSPTPIIIPTLAGSTGGGGGSGGTGSSNNGYDCSLVSMYPAFGTTFSARTTFDAVWTVKNTGRKDWDRNSVDLVYQSGDQIHRVAGYDLVKTIKIGSTEKFTVSMQAPKTAGNYTTYWTLRNGSTLFCKLTVNINVQ